MKEIDERKRMITWQGPTAGVGRRRIGNPYS
jgi:hypothetical protein